MALSIYCLVESILLIANALAILNDKRFLRKHFLDVPTGGMTVRNQLSIILYAMRTYMKWPLILFNCLFIFMELIIG